MVTLLTNKLFFLWKQIDIFKHYFQTILFMSLYFLVNNQSTQSIKTFSTHLDNNITNDSHINSINSSIGPELSLRDVFVVEFHAFPFIFMIGTMCNILTFIVMRRKRMRHQSTYFYMAVLAIADELVLINGCLNYWMYLYTTKMLVIMSATLCKLVCVAFYATLHFSVWMVVIMTIERFIAVTYPLQASSWCTVKRAKIATILLAFIIFSINFHFIFTHTLISRRNEPVGCQSKNETFDFFIEKIWPWIDSSVYSFVPLFLLIIFNILIVHNLVKASKKIKKMNSNISKKTNRNNQKPDGQNSSRCLKFSFLTSIFGKREIQANCQNNNNNNINVYDTSATHLNSKVNNNNNNYHQCDTKKLTVPQNERKRANSSGNLNNNGQQSSSSNANRRLTIMLLVISFTFLITSMPIVTLQHIEMHNRQWSTSRVVSIIKGVFLVLQYLNHSMNFFLYAVTGKAFRKEFFSLFEPCKKSYNKKFNKNDISKKVGNKNKYSNTYSSLLNLNPNQKCENTPVVVSNKEKNLNVPKMTQINNNQLNINEKIQKNELSKNHPNAPKSIVSSVTNRIPNRNNLQTFSENEKHAGNSNKTIINEINTIIDHSETTNDDHNNETNF